ncbi:hypothetical protein [Gardnerella pickettii]|uniref:hypothetical protein n=1 Tax=Gardnerella pickettii TaxID=2914924 RepID=UPI003399A7EE|nr:hypothetical protein [Bifidobacterium sp. UMB9259]
MLNKKAIAGIAAASIVVSCGFVGSFAFAEEVPNNPPKPAPVTTPTVKPEDDIYGSGSEWDQLQNTENEYENYYDQMYNTHTQYNGGHEHLTFDPHMFDEDHDPNGNDIKPEIPDEHKTDPQTPPSPEPKVDTTKEDAEFKAAQKEAESKNAEATLLKQMADAAVANLKKQIEKATGEAKTKLQGQLDKASKVAAAVDAMATKASDVVAKYTAAAELRTAIADLNKKISAATGEAKTNLQKQLKAKQAELVTANKNITDAKHDLESATTETKTVQANTEDPKAPEGDSYQSDADFKKAQKEAESKKAEAELLKQMADAAVANLKKQIEKATGEAKTKLQGQLDKASKVAGTIDTMATKASDVVAKYTAVAELRAAIADLNKKISAATGEAKTNLQKQLKDKQTKLVTANDSITAAKHDLESAIEATKTVQANTEDPQAPGHEPPAPKPVTPVTPKPVTPVTPHHDNPSVTPSVTPTPSTPSDETPSDDTPSSTPSVTTPSASTPAGASQSAPSAAPAAGVPAAPASVADLLPGLKGMITAGDNNVVVAGAVNRVTLNISNQAFLDRLNRDGSAKAYAFIYSSPRLLKGADGANYVTVRMVNGKPQFDAVFPAGYSGKHTVVLVDEQGNQLGWTDITVKSGVANGLPNSGVGVALTALAASVLAGAGAAFRKIRH